MSKDEAATEVAIIAAGLTAPRLTPDHIGRQIARANARDKIWPLEGYLLRQRLAASA